VAAGFSLGLSYGPPGARRRSRRRRDIDEFLLWDPRSCTPWFRRSS
jgi:hypothetical protein